MPPVHREPDSIIVEGAREHNLLVDRLELPKHRLVVITGPSGSGKSSLAFDTLYAEGQRRYVESLSAYARQFLGQMEKPKYERIRGLSPTIAIQQKAAGSNPRSTVGTITEIYDYLRVLFARAGEQRCYQCGGPVGARTAGQIVDELAELPDKTQVTVLAPKAENRKGEFRELFVELSKAGFVRVRIDGMIVRLDDVGALEKQKKHSIELVVDRITINRNDKGRLTDSVETALREGKGKLMVEVAGEKIPRTYSEANACPKCGIGFPELSPQSFSFNSPLGMCVECNGLGERLAADPALVIPDETLSIRNGAVAVWGEAIAKDSGWTTNIVKALAKAFKIDLDKPWNKLSDKQRDVLLNGTGDKRVQVTWEGRHSTGEWAMRFEGILLAQLERRHREIVERPHEGALRAVLSRDPVRGLQRHAPAARVARGVRQRAADPPGHRAHRQRRVRIHHDDEAHRLAAADRRRGPQRDQSEADVLARRRPRLPHAASLGRHAQRRRGAAYSSGIAARQRALGRAVRARRAVDRPAPARQRSADPCARCTACAISATPLKSSSSTTRATMEAGRLGRRLRPGRRTTRRPGHRAGHARRSEGA